MKPCSAELPMNRILDAMRAFHGLAYTVRLIDRIDEHTLNVLLSDHHSRRDIELTIRCVEAHAP